MIYQNVLMTNGPSQGVLGAEFTFQTGRGREMATAYALAFVMGRRPRKSELRAIQGCIENSSESSFLRRLYPELPEIEKGYETKFDDSLERRYSGTSIVMRNGDRSATLCIDSRGIGYITLHGPKKSLKERKARLKKNLGKYV